MRSYPFKGVLGQEMPFGCKIVGFSDLRHLFLGPGVSRYVYIYIYIYAYAYTLLPKGSKSLGALTR